jgi:hypothetical protein
MAGPIQALTQGIQDGTAVPAASRVTLNLRVQTATGFVGLLSDVVSFPGPSTIGNWVMPNQRVLVNGVPTIGSTSTGLAIVPALVPVTIPMLVLQGDARVSAM